MTQLWGRGDERGAPAARVCARLLVYVCWGMCGYRNRREGACNLKKKKTPQRSSPWELEKVYSGAVSSGHGLGTQT